MRANGSWHAIVSSMWPARSTGRGEVHALRSAVGEGGVPFVFGDDFWRGEVLRVLRRGTGAVAQRGDEDAVPEVQDDRSGTGRVGGNDGEGMCEVPWIVGGREHVRPNLHRS